MRRRALAALQSVPLVRDISTNENLDLVPCTPWSWPMLMRSVVLQQTLLNAYLKATVQEHVVGATSCSLRVSIPSLMFLFVIIVHVFFAS